MGLKEIPTENLGLSVRSTNSLKAAGLKNLEQIIIQSVSAESFKNIPNLGKKSVNEIKAKINELDIDNIDDIKAQEDRNAKLIFDNIKECVDNLFKTSFKRDEKVLKKRIFNGCTLEECGKEKGVTRERIRQIESKFFKAISLKLSDNYIFELQEYLKINNGITGFYELDNVGPAFKDISIYLAFSENPNVFLKFFFKSKKLLKWQKKKGEYYLYSYEGNSLDELINDEELLEFINSSQSVSLSESVKVYCMINDQESNFDYIFEEIQSKLSKRANFACLYAVTQLKKNFTYITTRQVIEFLKENCNKDFTSQIRTLDNILGSSDTKNSAFDVRDINLYTAKGQGNWFFLDKLEIDNIDQEEIVNFVLKVLKKNPDKNFNSKEFLDYFIETERLSKITIEILNKYIIDAILLSVANEHGVLNYLGRSMWSGNLNALKQKRIEIYPTVLKILKDNNAPMRLKDIKKELNKVRGGGKNFQIHTTLSSPKLIQLSKGLWGLRDRDINVSKEQELKILKFMQDEFSNGNKILDFNDIKEIKESINIDQGVSIYQISRMLLAHIPVGRRETPNKLIFLFKVVRENPLNFCFYSPEISDEKAQEYIDSKI